MNPEAAPQMGELGRITGVFLDPKKAFADIAARPRWIVPMLLVVIVTVAYTYLASQRVGWERIVRQSMESSGRMQQLTPEQREQAIERGASFAGVIGYAGAVVGTPVMVALIAVVLLLTSKMVGAQLTYAQLFAITAYAFLTSIVFLGLGILVMFLKNPDDFNIQSPLAFNLGAFLDPQSSPKALQRLGDSIDLFSFWRIALLAAGIQAAARKITFGKALAAVLIPWAVLVLCKVGWAVVVG